MKILIVSDTHRKNDNLIKILACEKPVDMLIHAGDAEGSEYFIESQADCLTEIVAGNNDFFSKLPQEREFDIGNCHVFLTHGHYYYVSLGTERIAEEGQARGANLVIYGHTHRPSIEEYGEMTVLNPGSLSYPRQEGRQASYAVMEYEKNSNRTEISLRFL